MPPPSPRSDEKAPAVQPVGAPVGTPGPGPAPGQRSQAPGQRSPGQEEQEPVRVVADRHTASPGAVPAPLPMPLSRFNAAPDDVAVAVLLRCCGSGRWAARIAACRPYPETESLLAALDEASYDMTPEDMAEALASESPQLPSPGGRAAGDGATGDVEARQPAGGGPRGHDRPGVLVAHTALRAAHAAYENRFGQPFLMYLDEWSPDERLDQVLAAIRTRLGNDPEEERLVVAEELRRLARARLRRLVGNRP